MPPPAERLRIVQVITRRQLRGAEVFAAQLAAELAARGHTVALAGLYSPRGAFLDPAGVERVDLGGRHGRVLSPRLLGATAAFLRAWRPSVVQANGSDTLKYLALGRRLARSRAHLVYRNISIASAWLRGPGHRAWNRWLAGQADAVAAVSPASARDYTETYRIPAERVLALPNGTPVPARVDREEARRRLASILGREPQGAVVLHAASFTPEKDQTSLVRAFARATAERPDAVLVLAGDGPLREEVSGLAGALGLGERVCFAGARGDLGEWMAGADLFALSSRIEGVPGVILEAAARGLPIVATAVGSVPDAVEDGATGLLVPAGDTGALADALDRLLAAPELRLRMGAAGREHVQRHFSLEGIVDRFEDLYRNLAEGAVG